jgi:hypothetical protein
MAHHLHSTLAIDIYRANNILLLGIKNSYTVKSQSEVDIILEKQNLVAEVSFYRILVSVFGACKIQTFIILNSPTSQFFALH